MLPDIDPNAIGQDLAATVSETVATMQEWQIRSLAELEQAVADRQRIADIQRRTEEYFKPIKAMAFKLHREICNRESAILAPLLRIDLEKQRAIGGYKARLDAERQERERQIAADRRKQAEADAIAEAAELEKSGHAELAEAIVSEALTAPAAIVALPDETKAIAGLKFVRRWYWKCAGGPTEVSRTPADVLQRTMKAVPLEFLALDEKKIGAYARNMKSSGSIPGIDIYFRDEPVR